MRYIPAAIAATILCLATVTASSQETSCTLGTTAMNFGVLGVMDSHVDSTSDITVNCPSGTPYTVGLDDGQANAGPAGRRIFSSSASISYGLYKDSARSEHWGQTGDAAGPVSGTGSGSNQVLTVYGRVSPQTAPAPGEYTDVITVVVTF